MNTEELMRNLKVLNNSEEDQIKIISALFINESELLKNSKIESLKNSLEQQIKFYGKKAENYQTKINVYLEEYDRMIEMIIEEYSTRLKTLIGELQNTQCNQKIAITNMKLSLDSNNKLKYFASENKKENYEIIIQECYDKLYKCRIELLNKIDEIFYNKDQQLIKIKSNFFQKIIFVFSGKKKIDKYVLESTEIELNNIENTVNNEIKRIYDETIKIIALIKNYQKQTQNIFNEIMEGRKK